MIKIIVLLMCLLEIFSSKIPCRKLNFFGNNIQNKAVLSPVIINGQVILKMPFGDFYNATIEIKTIIRGSLGEWKKKALVLSAFSAKNDSTDLCLFKSEGENSKIYFLEVLAAHHGEYRVLFNPEEDTRENLEEINKIICNGCAQSPKLLITEEMTVDNLLQLDCTTESMPPSIVNWVITEGSADKKVIALKNGARLLTKFANASSNAMYICTGANVFGESTTNLIVRGGVLRCANNDNLLCNGHGKCYKDDVEDGKMFCRCDLGFTGSRCSNNPNKLTSDYLVKSTVNCNGNGEGYVNVINKKEYCICNDNFFGPRCLKKTFNGGRSASSSAMDRSGLDKSEIEKMINYSTSQLALKYIIIGCAIVLCGCIIVVAAIIIVWKMNLYQSTKRMKRNRLAEQQQIASNNRSNGENHSMFPRYEDPALLTPSSDVRNVAPKSTFKMNNNSSQSNSDSPLFGHGIYEGVNINIS